MADDNRPAQMGSQVQSTKKRDQKYHAKLAEQDHLYQAGLAGAAKSMGYGASDAASKSVIQNVEKLVHNVANSGQSMAAGAAGTQMINKVPNGEEDQPLFDGQSQVLKLDQLEGQADQPNTLLDQLALGNFGKSLRSLKFVNPYQSSNANQPHNSSLSQQHININHNIYLTHPFLFWNQQELQTSLNAQFDPGPSVPNAAPGTPRMGGSHVPNSHVAPQNFMGRAVQIQPPTDGNQFINPYPDANFKTDDHLGQSECRARVDPDIGLPPRYHLKLQVLVDCVNQANEWKPLMYTFHPEINESIYNAKLRKQGQEIKKKQKGSKQAPMPEKLVSEVHIFRTAKADRSTELRERPPLALTPDSVKLPGFSYWLQKEGLTFNLYNFIDHSYEAHIKKVPQPDQQKPKEQM